MRRYMMEFVHLRCAPDLLLNKLFPNAKEITESMAAYNAVRSHIIDRFNIRYDDENIALVCVGDGSTPRTAALFAFRSNWQCFSIDPKLRDKEYDIRKLVILRRRIEDEILDLTKYDQVLVVLVHSHAKMSSVIENIKAKVKHIISIPCCVPHDIKNMTYLGYQDTNIWSPKNTVKIWYNIRQ